MASPVAALFVPGRLCLFGEHSDWAGALRARRPGLAPGRCLVAGTDQGLRAVAERAADVFDAWCPWTARVIRVDDRRPPR